MKEGYIVYVVGKEEVKEEKLNQFLTSHNFDTFPVRLSGRRPLISMGFKRKNNNIADFGESTE